MQNNYIKVKYQALDDGIRAEHFAIIQANNTTELKANLLKYANKLNRIVTGIISIERA